MLTKRFIQLCGSYLVAICFLTAVRAGDLPSPASTSGKSADGYQYIIREQSAKLCDAGTKQWTGTVSVGSGKNLFFWFFQSRGNPTEDPVIIFLQGGPAASSMMSLFSEVGPCTTDGKTTKRYGPSWANNANILFIDQPAGTGFSTVSSPSQSPVTLATAAVDFNALLSVFYSAMFPSLSTQPLHIAGESFGGRYVPAYTKYILERQKSGQKPSVPSKINSIILISASIDQSSTALGQIDHFCSDGKKGNGFGSGLNATACSAMKRAAPACEKAGQTCRSTGSLTSCRQATNTCGNIGRWFGQGVGPGGNNPYDDRLKCTKPPACRPVTYDRLVEYCNTPGVQSQLGVQTNFQGINFALNQRWTNAGDPLISSTKDLVYLLDQSDIRILAINGNNDVSVNTPGNIRALDAVPWSKQTEYRQQQFKPWMFTDAAGKPKQGGLTKGMERLLFFSVDNAGHDVPASQPEACLKLLSDWVKAGKLS